jgi:hypothetical protein
MQTKLVLQTQLAAFTALALISGTALAHDSRSHAADSSDDYRGAGGPFLGCGLRGADGVPTWQMFIGGSGYVRLLNGRLRLGGGGQASLTSTKNRGRTGSLRWGGLDAGLVFLKAGSWEFPLTLTLGGGRSSLEQKSGDAENGWETLERKSRGQGIVRVAVGAERRMTRTLKLALSIGWQGGFGRGGMENGFEASLQTVFLIPSAKDSDAGP